MNYSIATTTRRLLFPQHKLSCSWFLWQKLLQGLRERGRACTRESGAFLLGTREDGRARIRSFLLYDDLDPTCLDTGIVRLAGHCYGALWEYIERTRLSVVADVHVHPGAPLQSEADRAHPMIAQSGHVALILPRYACAPLRISNIGVYRFEGRNRWHSVPPCDIRAFFHVGF